jgi:hypothetical protein
MRTAETGQSRPCPGTPTEAPSCACFSAPTKLSPSRGRGSPGPGGYRRGRQGRWRRCAGAGGGSPQARRWRCAAAASRDRAWWLRAGAGGRGAAERPEADRFFQLALPPGREVFPQGGGTGAHGQHPSAAGLRRGEHLRRHRALDAQHAPGQVVDSHRGELRVGHRCRQPHAARASPALPQCRRRSSEGKPCHWPRPPAEGVLAVTNRGWTWSSMSGRRGALCPRLCIWTQRLGSRRRVGPKLGPAGRSPEPHERS